MRVLAGKIFLLPGLCQMLLGSDRAIQGYFCCENLGRFQRPKGISRKTIWSFSERTWGQQFHLRVMSQGHFPSDSPNINIYKWWVLWITDHIEGLPYNNVILICVSIDLLERRRKGWRTWGMHINTYGSVFWMWMSFIIDVPVENGLRTSTVRCALKSLCSVLPSNQHEFCWLHLKQHLTHVFFLIAVSSKHVLSTLDRKSKN